MNQCTKCTRKYKLRPQPDPVAYGAWGSMQLSLSRCLLLFGSTMCLPTWRFGFAFLVFLIPCTVGQLNTCTLPVGTLSNNTDCNNGGAGCAAAVLNSGSALTCAEGFTPSGPLGKPFAICPTDGGKFIQPNATNGTTCIDINECSSANDCAFSATCTNTVGSYACVCNPGYSGDGKTCSAASCTLPVGTLSNNTDCNNGGAGCAPAVLNSGSALTCAEGFTPSGPLGKPFAICPTDGGKFIQPNATNGTTCIDINECSSANDCAASARCTNTVGSYACVCNLGYSGDGKTCSAASCTLPVGTLSNNTDCNNGGAGCAPAVLNSGSALTCAEGFTPSGPLGKPFAICPTDGGKFIQPNATNGTTCIDINECSSANDCAASATCTNTVGSYACVCNPGYSGDGKTCSAASCTLPVGTLSNNTDCNNGGAGCTVAVLNSGSALTCAEGFTPSGPLGKPFAICPTDGGKFIQPNATNGTTCIDINECSSANDCAFSATCTNTVGSYACVCNPGYSGDGKTCSAASCTLPVGTLSNNTDCNNGGAGCTPAVLNSGSALTCAEGFTPSGPLGKPFAICPTDGGKFIQPNATNGTTCIDINECSSANDCAASATCTNTVGSYACVCNPGYSGDGKTCSAASCTLPVGTLSNNTDCNNGGAGCAPAVLNSGSALTCAEGFTPSGPLGKPFAICPTDGGKFIQPNATNGTTCIDINECSSANDCAASATCTNTVGSYACVCNPGYSGDGKTCSAASCTLPVGTLSDNTDCNNGGAGCTVAVLNSGSALTCAEGFTPSGPLGKPFAICPTDGGKFIQPNATNGTTCIELPRAVDDAAWTQVDTPVTVLVTANDVGAMNDPSVKLLPATVDLDPASPDRQTEYAIAFQGTASVDATGAVTFTPDPGFVGTFSVKYAVRNGFGMASDPATLTIRVNAPPQAADDAAASQAERVKVVRNDVDSDGTIDAATVDLDPATDGRQTTFVHDGVGTARVDGDGVVTFTPEKGIVGPVRIAYTVNDNDGATSNTAHLDIQVQPSCFLPAGYSIRNSNKCTQSGGGCLLATLKSSTPICAKGYGGSPRVSESATCNKEAASFSGITGCSAQCEYHRWSEWSKCCTVGTRTRTRAVAVRPQKGGARCPPSVERASCDTCAVDGGYGPWGKWGACSATCGAGVQHRTRRCDAPAPRHMGTGCEVLGPAAETRICRLPECSVPLISKAQGPSLSTARVAFTSYVQSLFTSVQVPLGSTVQGQRTSTARGVQRPDYPAGEKCVLPPEYVSPSDPSCNQKAGGCTLETLRAGALVCAKGYTGSPRRGPLACPRPVAPTATVQAQGSPSVQAPVSTSSVQAPASSLFIHKPTASVQASVSTLVQAPTSYAPIKPTASVQASVSTRVQVPTSSVQVTLSVQGPQFTPTINGGSFTGLSGCVPVGPDAGDVDCEMGEWGPWGPCDFPCSAVGQHRRQRAVAAPEGADGAAQCLATDQSRDCKPCGPSSDACKGADAVASEVCPNPKGNYWFCTSGAAVGGCRRKSEGAFPTADCAAQCIATAGKESAKPRANIEMKLTFQALLLHVQQYLGFVLGKVPTSAPQVTSTELVMYGTQMAVGTWLLGSFDMPKVTVGLQDIEIKYWGEGVERATIVVHDQSDAVAATGTTLDLPTPDHSWASQVVSVTRWDANGNKISAGAMRFTLCLGADYHTFGTPPEFHRYDDDSSVPNHLISEGGSVTDVGAGCYDVMTLRTSSIAAFNLSASPSPGGSPSPSPNATATADAPNDGTALLGLLALLVLPFLAVLAAMLCMSKRASKASTESGRYILGPAPLGPQQPIAAVQVPKPLWPSPNTSRPVTPAFAPAPGFSPAAPIR